MSTPQNRCSRHYPPNLFTTIDHGFIMSQPLHKRPSFIHLSCSSGEKLFDAFSAIGQLNVLFTRIRLMTLLSPRKMRNSSTYSTLLFLQQVVVPGWCSVSLSTSCSPLPMNNQNILSWLALLKCDDSAIAQEWGELEGQAFSPFRNLESYISADLRPRSNVTLWKPWLLNGGDIGAELAPLTVP